MQPIRSLLWIGPGRTLAQSGVAEAPTLDITWVPSVDAALALPPMTLDAAVIAGDDPGALATSLQQWRRRPRAGPAFIYLEIDSLKVDCLKVDRLKVDCLKIDPAPGSPARLASASAIRQLLAAGAQEVLVTPDAEEPGALRGELLARLDALANGPVQADPARGPSDAEPGESPAVVGRSAAMRDVHALAFRAAHSRATVLIQGETGTGKELVARLIHTRGERRKAAYVAINCAAFPETLLESELFGHRKGAFTGADRDRPGHFELAHRGTLFLDEIGETSPALQAKLLRVLQEREVLPVGASRPRPVNVRVIAATNRDLGEDTRTGRFREDLFYRLAVFPIPLPPLRERPDDILELAEHFLAKHGKREKKLGCRLSAAARRLLLSHGWPGNVRELENEIQRALALAEPGERIGPRLLSTRLTGLMEAVAQAPHTGESLHASLCSIEAWLIRRALESNGGRRAATARKLGVTREGLYKKMKRLGIA